MEMKKSLLGRLFNAFDAPIRVVYSNAGFVSTLLHRMMFWKLYKSKFDKLYGHFLKMKKLLDQQGINVDGKTILELGPGNSYLNAYLFLLNGAKKVILVDKFPRYVKNKKQKDFSLRELSFVKNCYPDKPLFFLDDLEEVKPGYIEFVAKELTDIDVKGLEVDLIYSISVLEHIRDVSSNVTQMARLLKPGGHMYHHIDMRDHYNFNNPFLFYKYSDETWNRWLTKEGRAYTNRWRYWDFKGVFEQSRLTVVQEQTQSYPLDKVKINSKWRGHKELDIGILDVLLNKKL